MNLGVGLLVMEMLGSLERSGSQIHLVFDEKVHFLDDGGGCSSSSLAWRSSNVPGIAERLFFRLQVDK